MMRSRVGTKPCALRLQKGGRQQRDFLLHVGGAAAEEVAVLLDQPVRVALPVRALGGDHVHVRDEVDRPAAVAVAAVADHQRGGLAERQHMDVGGGKSAGLEALGQILGDRRNLALAHRAFDAHDVRENLSRLGAHGGRGPGAAPAALSDATFALIAPLAPTAATASAGINPATSCGPSHRSLPSLIGADNTSR